MPNGQHHEFGRTPNAICERGTGMSPAMSNSRRQIRLRTLFAYTFVIAVCLALGTQLGTSKGLSQSVVLVFVLALPMLTIPSLLERAIDVDMPMQRGGFVNAFLILAVSTHSCLSLMLSTAAFAPWWKGNKGLTWMFYVNDGPAAVVMYPAYFGGAIAFAYAVLKPQQAVKSPLTFVAIALNVALSLWYVLFVLVMRYTRPGDTSGDLTTRILFALVPGSAAVAYALMLVALIRRSNLPKTVPPWTWAITWCGGFLACFFAKAPLAMRLYSQLPDKPPECFIVTAAAFGSSKGCGNLDRSRIWSTRKPAIASFLAVRRFFGRSVSSRSPALCVKRTTALGHAFAQRIATRWHADVVYVLLKPLEWCAVVFVKLCG